MEISDRSNEENDEIEEVTIEFGNFETKLVMLRHLLVKLPRQLVEIQ